MARQPRVVIPGVAHHVTQRGNYRQPIFASRQDRFLYLDLLAHNAERHGVRILGYCLMTNHVHLIAVPDSENSLARTLRPAHSEYSRRLNRVGERTGHLWQNRFYSCPMQESHLVTALRYIELNPVRAGLVDCAWDWPWSSARAHCFDGAKDAILDPGWTEYLGYWNIEEWREMLTSAVRDGDRAAIRRATITGQPLGSEDFLEEVEARCGRSLRPKKRGRPQIWCRTPVSELIGV